jgi:hypothetical protein
LLLWLLTDPRLHESETAGAVEALSECSILARPRMCARGIVDVTTDRVFLRLGPNGALGADEHQWILYRAGNAVSFVHSTKLILARCIQERGIELSSEGRAALDALADDFSTWRASPT